MTLGVTSLSSYLVIRLSPGKALGRKPASASQPAFANPGMFLALQTHLCSTFKPHRVKKVALEPLSEAGGMRLQIGELVKCVINFLNEN